MAQCLALAGWQAPRWNSAVTRLQETNCARAERSCNIPAGVRGRSKAHPVLSQQTWHWIHNQCDPRVKDGSHPSVGWTVGQWWRRGWSHVVTMLGQYLVFVGHDLFCWWQLLWFYQLSTPCQNMTSQSDTRTVLFMLWYKVWTTDSKQPTLYRPKSVIVSGPVQRRYNLWASLHDNSRRFK